MFMSMNPKSVAAGPRDKKVVEERLDGGSGFVCEGYVLRNMLLNVGAIHQIKPCHVVVQPGHSSCEELIDDHVVLIVLLVKETPFLAKSHALRIMLTVRMLQVIPCANPLYQSLLLVQHTLVCDRSSDNAASQAARRSPNRTFAIHRRSVPFQLQLKSSSIPTEARIFGNSVRLAKA